MLARDILALRLRNQQLSQQSFERPDQVVEWLGAVQSQDYYGAKWALGQRMVGATDEAIEQRFQEGAILRTHVMRPTWHFVAPADIRWMQMLTAPRVKLLLGHYDRKLGMDDETIQRSQRAFAQALGDGGALTRTELQAALHDAGIAVAGQALGHLVMHAELDALICSGPRRGKQFTYALIDARAPSGPTLTLDEALAELTMRYFRSHGPATLRDFVWWSGLTMGDARRGVEMLGSRLESERVGNKLYWLSPAAAATIPDLAHLLPSYDEYTVAYRERELFYDPSEAAGIDSSLTNVLVLAGRVVGTWGRALAKSSVTIELSGFGEAAEMGRGAILAAAERYGTFLGLAAAVA